MVTMVVFEQLSEASLLSNANLSQISTLLYGTDPHIYPAVCSKEDFLRLIPSILEAGFDAMFRRSNLFVAKTEDGRIVGLILWCHGGLQWNAEMFQSHARQTEIHLFDTFQQANREYFSSYAVETDAIQIINVCVDAAFRGNGIGTAMLDTFLSQHPATSFELACLAENKTALQLYRHAGFHIKKAQPGFSFSAQKPECLILEK